MRELLRRHNMTGMGFFFSLCLIVLSCGPEFSGRISVDRELERPRSIKGEYRSISSSNATVIEIPVKWEAGGEYGEFKLKKKDIEKAIAPTKFDKSATLHITCTTYSYVPDRLFIMTQSDTVGTTLRSGEGRFIDCAMARRVAVDSGLIDPAIMMYSFKVLFDEVADDTSVSVRKSARNMVLHPVSSPDSIVWTCGICRTPYSKDSMP